MNALTAILHECLTQEAQCVSRLLCKVTHEQLEHERKVFRDKVESAIRAGHLTYLQSVELVKISVQLPPTS